MAGERTKIIVQNIQKNLGTREVQPQAILKKMDNTQQEICRRGLALKLSGKITLLSGKTDYDIDGILWRIKELIEPSTWISELTIVHDSNLWKKIKRDSTISQQQPTFAHPWNKYLQLWSAPQVSGEVLFYEGYGMPENNLAMNVDPEIGSEWDNAIEFQATSLLANGDLKTIFSNMFESELLKWKDENNKEMIAGSMKRQHWSDIGF